MSNADWERAVEELYGILAEVASRSSTITYGNLARRLTSATLAPNSPALYKMLDDVSSPRLRRVARCSPPLWCARPRQAWPGVLLVGASNSALR